VVGAKEVIIAARQQHRVTTKIKIYLIKIEPEIIITQKRR
jgi:hypothetical protein